MSAPPATDTPPSLPWRDALKVYLEPATLRMFALGFSAGLPLLLVLGTLSFRLREAGVDRTTIGFLSWVGLAYGFKWVWAPLVDRVPIPPLTTLLGRRRTRCGKRRARCLAWPTRRPSAAHTIPAARARCVGR